MKIVKTKRSNGSIRVSYDYSDEKTCTQQQFKDQCDLNSVLENYRKTGTPLPKLTVNDDIADFSKIGDFQDSMNIVRESIELFEALPAVLRKKMGNDPSNLNDYLLNNADEAIKFGLMTKKEVASQTPINDDKTTKKGDSSATPS